MNIHFKICLINCIELIVILKGTYATFTFIRRVCREGEQPAYNTAFFYNSHKPKAVS